MGYHSQAVHMKATMNTKESGSPLDALPSHHYLGWIHHNCKSTYLFLWVLLAVITIPQLLESISASISTRFNHSPEALIVSMKSLYQQPNWGHLEAHNFLPGFWCTDGTQTPCDPMGEMNATYQGTRGRLMAQEFCTHLRGCYLQLCKLAFFWF